MTPGETTARLALADMMGILSRGGNVLSRYQAIEDRLFQVQRELEEAAEAAYGEDRTMVPVPDCNCGEAECKRGVCR